MVHLYLRRWKRIQFQRDLPRCQLRALLKKAARHSDPQAYLDLIAPYIDLAHEYLYLTGFQSAGQRREATLKIFTSLWTRLQYTGRLSDFERLLTRTLLQVESRTLDYHTALEGAVAQLAAKDRFLLVAREMEDWHPRWIALACRRCRRRLEQRLMQTRCRLAGFDEKKLRCATGRLLCLLSRSFDEVWPESRRKTLGRTVLKHPDLLAFKGSWLELRCKLIELRQDLRLDPEQRENFNQALLQRIEATQALRPCLSHRVVNLFKFEAFPDFRISN